MLSCWAIIEELREAQLPVIISSAERVHIVIIARTSSLGYHVDVTYVVLVTEHVTGSLVCASNKEDVCDVYVCQQYIIC